MTQPIQEPSTDRSLQGFAYARDQIFRRPAPRGSSSLPYFWARWIGSEAIPSDTLRNPATAGTPDVPYEEYFIHDPDGLADFDFDPDTGCLQWFQPGNYYVWAAASWNGTWTVGTTLGTVLDLGEECTFSTVRVVNTIQSDLVNENMRIPVDCCSYDFASDIDSFRCLVYHTDPGGGNDIGSVRIHVVQLNSAVDGEFFT